MATNQNPYLLIVCGPTGSGKGSLPEKVQKKLGLGPGHIEKILIDDIIENNQSYKTKVYNFYKNTFNYPEGNSTIKIENIMGLINSDQFSNVKSFFNNNYKEARHHIDCDTGKPTIPIPPENYENYENRDNLIMCELLEYEKQKQKQKQKQKKQKQKQKQKKQKQKPLQQQQQQQKQDFLNLYVLDWQNWNQYKTDNSKNIERVIIEKRGDGVNISDLQNKLDTKFTQINTNYVIINKPLVTCDEKNNNKLKNAFKNEKNIIFETTGEYPPYWLFDRSFQNIEKYTIIFAWTGANVEGEDGLITRNATRAATSISEFLDSYKSSTGNSIIPKSTETARPAPRLPEIGRVAYITKVYNIISTYKTLFNLINNNIPPKNTPPQLQELKLKLKIKLLVYNNKSPIGRGTFYKDQDITEDTLVNLYFPESGNTKPGAAKGGKRKGKTNKFSKREKSKKKNSSKRKKRKKSKKQKSSKRKKSRKKKSSK